MMRAVEAVEREVTERVVVQSGLKDTGSHFPVLPVVDEVIVDSLESVVDLNQDSVVWHEDSRGSRLPEGLDGLALLVDSKQVAHVSVVHLFQLLIDNRQVETAHVLISTGKPLALLVSALLDLVHPNVFAVIDPPHKRFRDDFGL